MAALLLAFPVAAAARGSTPQPLGGAFTLDRMLTFYVVNDAATGFTVTVRWLSDWQASTDTPVYVRVLDPNEQIIARTLDPGERITGTPAWHTLTIPVPASGAGVYQVILTSFTQTNIEFSTDAVLPWGVYGYPTLRSKQPNLDAYIYLPPSLPNLSVSAIDTVSSLQLIDANNVVHVNLAGSNTFGATALPTSQPDTIWRLVVRGSQPCGLGFGIAPIILCPDEATALAIHSSIDVLPDGTVCYHKFQVAAHDLLEQYRQLGSDAYALALPNFDSAMSGWLANPTRNSLLVGGYGVFAWLPTPIAEQNLNPASPWFGTIHSWMDQQGNERPENPWTTYDRLNMTTASPTLNMLAAVYATNESFNPVYHDLALRNRIIISALQEMMMIREHGLPMPIYLAYDGGTKAFAFAYFMRWFPWVIAECPGDVRSVLLEGCRRYTDHMALGAVPELVNQWSFIMIGLQSFARGCGEQFYRDIVARQVDCLLSRRMFGYGATPAGYISEGEGPETTYTGILVHNLAWLAEDSGDSALKQALRRTYRLMNHTVAPEPGGQWLGASSFAHRTPDSWVKPQWGGGIAIMGDDSEDAAAMLGRTLLPATPPRNASQLQQAQAQLQLHLQYYPPDYYNNPNFGLGALVDAPMIHYAAWEHFMAAPLVGQLPMKERDRFTRKMGDEFLFVRRPGYYAFLYTGKTAEAWRETSRPTNPNEQYPRNGGGLSMFWSPRFGTSILAQNWSAYSTNSVIGVKGGQTYFENYWRTTSGLQEALSRATINGDISDSCMSFRRQVNFLEDRVQCDLRLTAGTAATYTNLWECFPYPVDKPDPIRVKLYDANGVAISGNNKMASAIVFSVANANEVHVIAFKSPRNCEFGTSTSNDIYGHARETGRVLTALPVQWNSGQSRMFKWSMKAVRPNQVQQTIKQMIQAM